jgi:hypothetical protein
MCYSRGEGTEPRLCRLVRREIKGDHYKILGANGATHGGPRGKAGIKREKIHQESAMAII